MRIEEDLKLDFSDVLIKPKRSTISSRKDVDLHRTFKLKNGNELSGIPVIAANMDTVATFAAARELSKYNCFTALHKHYSIEELISFFGESEKHRKLCFYSMGISDADLWKFEKFYKAYKLTFNETVFNCGIDVANGYQQSFVNFVSRFNRNYPDINLMAGNVVTAEMTEELILSGVSIVKIGIGSGSACETRMVAGVGYPQLSAVIECADAAHGLGGLICSDGGCVTSSDISKAFGGGSDFVMAGGLFAAHTESGGEIVETDGQQFMKFYGMSSKEAMEKHNGGVAEYRSSEGKTVLLPYRGPISETIRQILGGVRSSATYIGAKSIKEMPKRTTFIRVNNQYNKTFNKYEPK